MRKRQAFLGALFLGAGLWGGCNRPADEGYYTISPTEGGSGGSKGSSSSDNGGNDDDSPPPEPAPAPTPTPQESDGGTASTDDAGTTEPEPNPEPEPEPVVPDYEPAVIMDDGVLDIWTLGDSITVGVNGGFRNDIYNLLTNDGYKVDLVGTLKDDSAEIDDIDHEGHTAYTFEKTRADMDGWLAQVHRPDVVLLYLGANDFAWWTNLQPADHLVTMMDLIDHLVTTLPGAAIVVATLTPQSSEIVESVHRNRTDMVKEFDDLLRVELPKHPEYGEHVFMADLGAHILVTDLYDGIHPTREAHKEIGQVWYEVMKEILPPAP